MGESKTLDQPGNPPAPPEPAVDGVGRHVSPIPESCLDASGKPIQRSPEEIRRRNERALALLQSFVDDGDEEEQRETMGFLRRALGVERTISERKLF